MSHSCKAFLVHCMDFRLGKTMKEFLEKENLINDCDIVSIAGGVKDLDFVLSQLDISVSLHQTSEVILSNHTDCGAYGGSSKFESLEEERLFHTEEMQKSKDVILQKYPQLNIRMILGIIENGKEIILEEIK